DCARLHRQREPVRVVLSRIDAGVGTPCRGGPMKEGWTVNSTGSRSWYLFAIAVAACGGVPRPITDAAPAADGPPPLRAITVRRSHGGGGTVTSSIGGIACGTSCTASVSDGTTVVLTATADTGSTFTGWSGPCTGTDTTCSFKVSDDVTVGAAFDLRRYTVTVALAGAGTG